MKAIAPHLLLSDTNPKLAFHLASSFSQTAVPGVILIDIKTQGIDPIAFYCDESVAKTQPETQGETQRFKIKIKKNHSCRIKPSISQKSSIKIKKPAY